MDEIVGEIASLAARHKLVPFLGAGCSAPHLKLDWDSLIRDMAAELGVEPGGNLEVAEQMVATRGQAGLAAFLRERLLVSGYDDNKGTTHLAVVCLNIGLTYTTNQDNVFEECCKKYGRPWRRIVTYRDLGEYRPGERLYVKYHGDLDEPDSIVFATRHYEERRRNPNHFLNVRLKSDLLAKQLLFVGYSLRDDTVKDVLGDIRTIIGRDLPPSYLVAYTWTPELESLCASYGVKVVDPMKLYPDSTSKGEAVDRFLQDLLSETVRLKRKEEMGLHFDNPTPSTVTMICKYEIEALKKALPALPVEEATKKFRASFDLAEIPVEFQRDVVNIFIELCRRCSTEDESDELNAAIFNLQIVEVELALDLAAAVMTTATSRTNPDLFRTLRVVGELGALTSIITAARATEMLSEWQKPITESFVRHVGEWADEEPDFDSLSEELKAYVTKWMDEAWKTKTTLEHPIKRQQRLATSKFPRLRAPRFHTIAKQTMSVMPRSFKKPFDE